MQKTIQSTPRSADVISAGRGLGSPKCGVSSTWRVAQFSMLKISSGTIFRDAISCRRRRLPEASLYRDPGASYHQHTRSASNQRRTFREENRADGRRANTRSSLSDGRTTIASSASARTEMGTQSGSSDLHFWSSIADQIRLCLKWKWPLLTHLGLGSAAGNSVRRL